MQKVVLATGNADKVRELAHLLAGFGLDVVEYVPPSPPGHLG